MGQVPSSEEHQEEDTLARTHSSEDEVPELIDPESDGFRRLRENNMAEGGRVSIRDILYSDDEHDDYGLGLDHYFFDGPPRFITSSMGGASRFFSINVDSEEEYHYTSEGDEPSDYTLSDESMSDLEGTMPVPCPAPGGYDFDFVVTPPEDLHCSVCLFVLREPQLTSCCGHHFCKGCISRVLLRGKSCPLCQAGEFTVMLDKNFQRKINDLKIKCMKNGDGCKWVGEIKTLEAHTDESSGDCGYVEVDCKYKCGEKVRKQDMDKHIETTCSQRPFICKHCSHKSSFAGIMQVHYEACMKYPVECPNECGIDPFPREALREHVDKDCPLEMITCEFEFAGCSVRTPRKDMPEHISESSTIHLRKVAESFQVKLVEKDKEIASLKRTLEEQGGNISSLQQKLSQQQQQIDRLVSRPPQTVSPVRHTSPILRRLPSTIYCCPPVEFVMSEYSAHKTSNKQWFSEPFYTGEEGYKMCLSVFANGIGVGKGSHLSLFANMMCGEFDDELTWPFRGAVLVHVRLDHKKEYYEANLVFNSRSPLRACARVCGIDRNPYGQGAVRFLSHSKLQPLPSTVRLRVVKVNVL